MASWRYRRLFEHNPECARPILGITARSNSLVPGSALDISLHWSNEARSLALSRRPEALGCVTK